MNAVAILPMPRPDFTVWRRAVALIVAAYGLRAQFDSVGDEEWMRLYTSGMEPADAVIEQETRLQ